jgi:hypothetical protein
MVSATTTSGNGQARRRQLSDQIDRLDGILDGLSEALDGVIVDAVRGAVGQAVREAVAATVREMLSSPELLRAALARHEPPAAAAPPVPVAKVLTLSDALSAALRGLWPRARKAASAARQAPRAAWRWALRQVREALSRAARLAAGAARGAWRFRGATAAGLFAGAAAATAAYVGGPALAALLSGLGGALVSAAGVALWPLWRLLAAAGDRG